MRSCLPKTGQSSAGRWGSYHRYHPRHGSPAERKLYAHHGPKLGLPYRPLPARVGQVSALPRLDLSCGSAWDRHSGTYCLHPPPIYFFILIFIFFALRIFFVTR